MLELFLVIAGIIGLLLGTELVVNGSLNIGRHFKLSQLFVGLTILTIGTNLPELIISVTGAYHKLLGVDTSGLVVGEIIGSCVGQIGLALGLLGLFGVLTLTKREFLRDGFMMVGSVLFFYIIIYDGSISRLEGVVLLLVYLFYFFSLYREEKVFEKMRAPTMHIIWDLSSIIGGFAILVYSSEVVVNNSVLLADVWNVSQSFIGVVLIGLGTSLPEIFVSFTAIRKGAFMLSVGNLIGSNIFDLLVVPGLGSAIAGFNVSRSLISFDIPFLFIISVLAILFFWKDRMVTKKEAGFLLGLYILYIALKFRGF